MALHREDLDLDHSVSIIYDIFIKLTKKIQFSSERNWIIHTMSGSHLERTRNSTLLVTVTGPVMYDMR